MVPVDDHEVELGYVRKVTIDQSEPDDVPADIADRPSLLRPSRFDVVSVRLRKPEPFRHPGQKSLRRFRHLRVRTTDPSHGPSLPEGHPATSRDSRPAAAYGTFYSDAVRCPASDTVLNVSVALDHLDLQGALAALAVRRPVFHGEADLQHELAWQLHSAHADLGVRLEVRVPNPSRPGHRERVDLLLLTPSGPVAVEVKYPTDSLKTVLGGELVELPRQGAQDTTGYDVIKDIHRVEHFVHSGMAVAGAVVVVTNDASYWTDPAHGRITGAAAFRLYDGTTLEGERSWGEASGPGTRKSREEPIGLMDAYTLGWNDYSLVEGARRGRFRSLLVEVGTTPHGDLAMP